MQTQTLAKNPRNSKIFYFEVPYSQTDIIKAFEGLMTTFKIKNEVNSDDFDIMKYAGIVEADIPEGTNIKDMKLKDENYRKKFGL